MKTGECRSRFVGCLLGSAFGDALGAAVEMQSCGDIRQQFGQVRDFLPHDKGFGCYTDDTEMTLALARSLIVRGQVDAAVCSRHYAEAFSPERGYGRSAVKIIEALAEGADYRQTGTMLFSQGSFGNGAAMRIAPVGLLYRDASEKILRQAVFDAVCCTHVHPEAVEAASLQALSVALLSKLPVGEKPDTLAIVEQLERTCRFEPLVQSLRMVTELLRTAVGGDKVARCFGCGVRSSDSWPPALWAALRFADDPEEAIIQAVNLGGDADTIGAMTGALVGALHGDGWFPSRWFGLLENGPDGRDEIISVAEDLADSGVSVGP
ncbi:MAG TPA: ADP-ribosylglycohydrolase family protein [Geopsychrobacteraceae bacterium]|nr:ADP-ribosylglycohydrolase family protein [Geopsychrobacteraceae bacterium]